MGPKIKDITKPHLRNFFRKEGDQEVKGTMVEVVLGESQLGEDLKKCLKSSE